MKLRSAEMCKYSDVPMLLTVAILLNLLLYFEAPGAVWRRKWGLEDVMTCTDGCKGGELYYTRKLN